MSLPVYTRVLWRFRFLVVIGFILAVVLAVEAYAKVEFVGGRLHTTPRKAEVWQAESRLFLTTTGFPAGVSRQQYAQTAGGSVPVADPVYLATLASTYADFAGRDAVRALALKNSPVKGKIGAEVETTLAGSPTQVIDLQVTAGSAAGSVLFANRTIAAFQHWVRQQQQAAGQPQQDRVVLQVLTKPQKPTLLVPRKKTLSIVAFLAVMTAIVGLAFVLENMRPSVESLVARRTALAVERAAAQSR